MVSKWPNAPMKMDQNRLIKTTKLERSIAEQAKKNNNKITRTKGCNQAERLLLHSGQQKCITHSTCRTTRVKEEIMVHLLLRRSGIKCEYLGAERGERVGEHGESELQCRVVNAAELFRAAAQTSKYRRKWWCEQACRNCPQLQRR